MPTKPQHSLSGPSPRQPPLRAAALPPGPAVNAEPKEPDGLEMPLSAPRQRAIRQKPFQAKAQLVGRSLPQRGKARPGGRRMDVPAARGEGVVLQPLPLPISHRLSRKQGDSFSLFRVWHGVISVL